MQKKLDRQTDILARKKGHCTQGKSYWEID